MRRSVLAGLLLAVVSGVLIILSEPLSLHVEGVVLLGVAVGALLAVVGDHAAWEKLAAFAIGLVATWLAYGMRAGFLPDSPTGRMVAAVGLIGLLVLVAWLSAGRLELWPMLLGVAALAGAYEFTFTAAPPRFVQESPVALTGVLLAVAFGYAVVTLVTMLVGPDRQAVRQRPGRAGPDETEAETEVPLDEMFHRDEEVRS
jgi:lysylphosphatidylglycerol synthetase-like protein (DUF2156 family)